MVFSARTNIFSNQVATGFWVDGCGLSVALAVEKIYLWKSIVLVLGKNDLLITFSINENGDIRRLNYFNLIDPTGVVISSWTTFEDEIPIWTVPKILTVISIKRAWFDILTDLLFCYERSRDRPIKSSPENLRVIPCPIRWILST